MITGLSHLLEAEINRLFDLQKLPDSLRIQKRSMKEIFTKLTSRKLQKDILSPFTVQAPC